MRWRVNKLPASLVKNAVEYSAGVVPERASSIRCRTLSIRHVRRPLVLHTPSSRSRRSIAPNLFCQQKRSECHSLDQMVDYCTMFYTIQHLQRSIIQIRNWLLNRQHSSHPHWLVVGLLFQYYQQNEKGQVFTGVYGSQSLDKTHTHTHTNTYVGFQTTSTITYVM